MEVYEIIARIVDLAKPIAVSSLFLLLPISFIACAAGRNSALYKFVQNTYPYITAISIMISIFGGYWVNNESIKREYVSAGYTLVAEKASANNDDVNLILEKDGNLYWANNRKRGRKVELFSGVEKMAESESFSSFASLVDAVSSEPFTLSEYENLSNVDIRTYK